jgi:peptidoglycan/xylan/chitin deacetylase (PgdA/CDA1 family)
MSPQLLITVDTELSNFPQGQGLWGKIGSEDWGLGRMTRVFDELGIRGTFFLDVYGKTDEELNHQRRAAEMIVESGHDLQLHTHPAPAFDPARPQLRDYKLEEQRDIIQLGCERLTEWAGVRPVLHRAGDWAADHNSLDALLSCGFRADFSASVWSKSCGIDASAILGNGWTRVDGMLCGVGTSYHDRLTGRLRRIDLGGVSFREVLDVLSHRINPLFLTLHSFSFLQFNRARTEFRADPNYIENLRRFCSIAREEWGYRSMTALSAVTEIEAKSAGALPWSALPTTGAASSASGLLKSIRSRVASFAQ